MAFRAFIAASFFCFFVVGVFSFSLQRMLLSRKNFFSEFATLHLVLADRRATARTRTFVEPCSIQTKKNGLGLSAVSRCEMNGLF